jgi:glycosyltransferase involved in cell wall biosynthesis
MSKPLCIISSPVDTFSGYGARSRDFIKSLIKAKGEEWDIKLLSQRWGQTPFGALNLEIEEEADLKNRIIGQITMNLPSRPDVWIQISVPNEFQPVGSKFNLGITAGIETTICDPSWIEGLNRMDLNLVSSEHSKQVFKSSKFEQKNQVGQVTNIIELKKPIEILFEGADLNKYFKTTEKNDFNVCKDLDSIKENFAFLFVGHWLQGDFGEDRKNVGYLIKAFLETFKNKKIQPALILKVSQGATSILDRDRILTKIDDIRKTVHGGKKANIYVIHGDLTDEEINAIYNHQKVKAMVNLTKGEGFGRPLLEFSIVGKPIIASGWSGHLDFLPSEFAGLIGGTLNNVHQSAHVQNTILMESQWFKPDDNQVGHAFNDVFEKYKDYQEKAKRLAFRNKQNFSFDKMTEKLGGFLAQYVPEFPKQVSLVLPKLNKIKPQNT